MDLNGIIFPAPTSSYTFAKSRTVVLPGSRETPSPDPPKWIPCLYIPSLEHNCQDILLYFHANAEDIGLAEDFLRSLRDTLECHVLGVEYPGYGVYKGKPDEDEILSDAEAVFDTLVQDVGIDPSHIHILGRSIGSGPAVHLSSVRNPGSLILVSAYLSIKKVSSHLVGRALQNVSDMILRERFPNEEKISKVDSTCPILLIHGRSDDLIPVKHAQELYERAKSSNRPLTSIKLEIREATMRHNTFNLYQDIINPLYEFWRDQGILAKMFGSHPIDEGAFRNFREAALMYSGSLTTDQPPKLRVSMGNKYQN